MARDRNQRLEPSVPTVRFHLYEISGEAQLKGQETDQWLPEPGSGVSRLAEDTGELCGVMGIFCASTVMMAV